MYKQLFKRWLDFTFSLFAIVILSPIFVVLIVLGVIVLKGSPFFLQERPGLNEKIFRLIKFRSMSNERDENNQLLPNEMRLNRYGAFLRSTSLDELPELFNVLIGEMALVGPRPLLPEYLPYYTEEEHRRHEVRPGLTGLAQVNGRNAISSWEERFSYDLEYVNRCSLVLDVKIILKTVGKVFKREDIKSGGTKEIVGRLDDIRRAQYEEETVVRKR